MKKATGDRHVPTIKQRHEMENLGISATMPSTTLTTG